MKKKHHHPIVKYGIVSGVRPGQAKVNFTDDKIVSDWLEVLVRKSKTDKESWQLEINEQVICLMDDDKCVHGTILGAIYSNADPADPGEGEGKFRKKFSDGTEIEYDKKSHKLTVDVKGEIIAKATVTAKIEAPVITLTGSVTVTGALTAASIATTGGGAVTASGNMTVTGTLSAGSVESGGISLSTHRHSGVQNGGGISDPPL